MAHSSLAPGARLGPYEIIAALGAGGFGEVYKARDTRLDRTVAIKILPSADADTRARFEREAKAIAALQHPHICTLHDVGHQDGTDFLVLELLDGETLAERIARGSLKQTDALTIATQIADALDKAHRAGIVHRDLKPANVMLTTSGVKLLDFGLAKLRPQSPGLAGLSVAATMTSPPVTAIGTIVGTLHYMSPEQVEGKDADARSDVFAFGVVLYEMLTGVRPFDAKSAAGVMASIIEQEPTPLVSRLPSVSPALEHIVARCLTKNPEARYQSAADLVAELRWVNQTQSVMAAPAPSGVAATSSRRLPWVLAATAAVVAAAAAAFVTLRMSSSGKPEPETVVRFSVASPPGSFPTSFVNQAIRPDVSPDGTQVLFKVFADGSPQVAVRSLSNEQSRMVPGTSGGNFPTWSPDGQSIAFVADDKIKRLALASGTVTTVCDAPPPLLGMAWSRTGVIVIGMATGGLMRVNATGGVPTPLTSIDAEHGETSHRHPRMLPDGDRYLYFVQPQRAVYLASLSDSRRTKLLEADSFARYVEPGYLLFSRGRTLFAQRFDADRTTLTGDPVSLIEDLTANVAEGAAGFAAEGRTLAFRVASASVVNRQLRWYDRHGNSGAPLGRPGQFLQLRLSRSGTKVLLGTSDQGSGSQLNYFTLDLDTNVMSKMGPAGSIGSAVWAPDERRIAFVTAKPTSRSLSLFSVDSGDVTELYSTDRESLAVDDWLRDGSAVIFHGGNTIYSSPMAARSKETVLFDSPGAKRTVAVDPTGATVAFTVDRGGLAYDVFVAEYPSFRSVRQVSGGGGYMPRWRGDGRELYFTTASGKMMAVPITRSPELKAGAPVELFSSTLLPGGGANILFEPAPDGQRFLVLEPVATDNVPLSVILNWTSLLNDTH